MLRICLATLLLFAAALPARAQEKVDLELVLLADASGSVDNIEIGLQRAGYAEALRDPEVLWAIRNGGALGRIAITYVEWASEFSQDVVADWTIIEDEADARAFGDRIMAAPRLASGSNAIGAALYKALDMIEGNDIEAWRRVIDFSADSMWNGAGPPLSAARDAVLGADVVINGLAVKCRNCSGRPRPGNLEQDFTDYLIGGPGAFVITAGGDTSFAHAVRRKLILEIAGLPRPADSHTSTKHTFSIR